MIIQSKNFSLKLDEILKDEISAFYFNETEKTVIKLAKKWLRGDDSFQFTTSGSTGLPKTVTHARDKIILSTKSTFAEIDPNREIKSSLLCIDPKFIGGAMVVFRALIENLDLYIIEPTSSIVESLRSDSNFDLVSMVPLQFNSLPTSQLHRFKTILIGGAPMNTVKEYYGSTVYSTYGMTETVSHIALRKLHERDFHTTGNTKVRVDSNGLLEFSGSITDNEWIKTNDLGEINSEVTFKWIGRADFIINSGGIKLNPENIEEKLSNQISSLFLVTSIPDKKLGERLVLVLEDENDFEIDFSELGKYEIPKTIFRGVSIERTNSGKVDRIKTKENLLSKL